MKRLTPEQVEALNSLPLGVLPNRILIARKMLGWSQPVLAAAAGISQATISDAEAGRPILLPTAQALAGAMGAGVDVIFPARQAVA